MLEILALLSALETKLQLPKGILVAMSKVESGHRNVVVANDGGSASYGPLQGKAATLRSVHPGLSESQLQQPAYSTKAAAIYFAGHLKRYGSLNRALCRYNTGKPYNNCVYARKVIKEYEVLRN